MLREKLQKAMADSIDKELKVRITDMLECMAGRGNGDFRLQDDDDEWGFLYRMIEKSGCTKEALEAWLWSEGIRYRNDCGTHCFSWMI